LTYQHLFLPYSLPFHTGPQGGGTLTSVILDIPVLPNNPDTLHPIRKPIADIRINPEELVGAAAFGFFEGLGADLGLDAGVCGGGGTGCGRGAGRGASQEGA